MIRCCLIAAFGLGLSYPGLSVELAIHPAEAPLIGAKAQQPLLVLQSENGKAIADKTATAIFRSSNPAVAAVDGSGVVRPTGDGEAIITAECDGRKATAKVRVSKFREPFIWSFRNHVIPAMTKAGCNSGACHGALAGKGGMKLSLRGYDPESDHYVLSRQALARRIDRQDPAKSLFLLKPTRKLPHGGGRRFEDDSADYRMLQEWIAAGAEEPRSEDAALDRLEVFPQAAVLKPGDSLRVIVRAWYTDGRVEDVSHWSRFSSSEDLVAAVSDEGLVKIAGPGEASINVGFGTRVAAATVTVPYAHTVDRREYSLSPRQNYIDEYVLAKLQLLNVIPSGQCTDHEFVRRAYLDAAGILPSPEEVDRFVADADPKKRTQLIESLLSRSEFIDYWAYKWSDLLLVSSKKLPQPAMWAFYRFIRASVADNKPWDQFARDIVTAGGSTLHNGAANYFVLHKDISDLSEATSVAFLGMSLTCCRCHNHPLEKWTQDQYWSFANLFSRVTLKNGDRAGEVMVQAQPYGDVAHLRRGAAMPPAPLDARPLAIDDASDRRLYFAQWLTAADNPFFARAIVNRVWRNFMGRGLVEAEDDLRDTNPPSNRELFDALVKDFVAHRFDVKHLIRVIMNSAAYQRSSRPRAENAADDRFYSRYLVRRLSAEVILDAYAQVTGVPTPFDRVYTGVEGGTAPTPNYPAGVRALQLPDSQVASNFLNAFGRPERLQTCSCERQQDATVGQALHLNNGQTLNDKLRSKQCRIEKWLDEKISDETAIRRVFMLALNRPPTEREMTRFREILSQPADPRASRREALEDVFWAVLTGREFLFNH